MTDEKTIAEFPVPVEELRVLLRFASDEATCSDLERLHFVDGELLTVDGFRLVRRKVAGVSAHPHLCFEVTSLRLWLDTLDGDIVFRITEKYADVICGDVRVHLDAYLPEKLTAKGIKNLTPTSPSVFQCIVTARAFGDFAGMGDISKIVKLRFHGEREPIEFTCGDLNGLIMPAVELPGAEG